MTHGHLQIEPATIADASAIAECVAAAYQHYIPRLGKPPGPMLDDYAEIIRQHTVYIIRGNHLLENRVERGEGTIDELSPLGQRGRTVAALLVLMEKDVEGSSCMLLLDNIAVHPDAQGHGCGRALMALAESVARERGYEALCLYTHELMTENIALYKRLGYSETARRTEKGFRRVYMQKSINKIKQ